VQRRDRRRVVDHPVERIGQREQAAQPGERHLLELGGRGRGAPQHRLLIQRRGKELGEHGGRAGADREVGKEPGMVPVRQRRHEHPFEVREDGVEVLTPLGCVGGQRRADVPGRDAGQDGVAFGVFEVLGDPVDEGVAVSPEVVAGHTNAPLIST
jgi:hypothetical protein